MEMVVPSLQRSCLRCIARDMKWWCKDVSQDMGRYKYVLGPFDGLNSRLIQELITILAKSQLMKASYFNVLLHSNLKTLDVSVCSQLVSDQVLKLIVSRCKKLTHLCLKNCNRLSFKALKDVPRNLPNLLYLDFSCCTSCSNETLHEIATHCPMLQVLRVDSCHQVNDSGILALFRNGNQKQNGCTKIVELNLSSTSVTDISVKTILQSQPHIRSLSLAALHSERQITFSYPSVGPTKLSHIDVSHTDISDTSVQNICRLCPFLVEISINCCNQLTGKSLEAVSSLQHLQHFNMAQYGLEPQIHFSTDVVPFLQKCGIRLETLNLSSLSGVDTSFLAMYCPKLSKLILEDCGNISGRRWRSNINYEGGLVTLTQACTNLQCLDLQNAKFSSSCSTVEHMAAIIGVTCGLKELNLSHVEGLSDECLEQSLLSSDVSNLSLLDLSYCSEISAECTENILDSCSCLSSLSLSHCRKITFQNAESLRKMSKENGRALEIIWV